MVLKLDKDIDKTIFDYLLISHTNLFSELIPKKRITPLEISRLRVGSCQVYAHLCPELELEKNYSEKIKNLKISINLVSFLKGMCFHGGRDT